MKKLQYISFLFILFSLAFIGCDDDNIDPITKVDPGADSAMPVVNIISPIEGFQIQVPDPLASVGIELRAEDDIELISVTVSFDGTEIASYNEFTDYRIVTRELVYDQVTTGEHVISVAATDLAGNTTTNSVTFSKEPPYTPQFQGEMFYMPFDGSYSDLITFKDANEVGNPGFAGESVAGSDAYKGATDSYLTFPTTGMLGNEFSASFWYKLNNDPDRAGILVIGPPDTNNPDAQNNRSNGFRFFRENASGMQRFKLNVGNGTADTWVDGGAAADVDPSLNEWVHMAFTISETEAIVYINGVPVKTSTITGVGWEGCDILSIMSGAPRFTGWNHRSDRSQMDELRLFNKALSPNEITQIIAKSSIIFNMKFNGSYSDTVTKKDATEVGNPGFAGESVEGLDAYAGAADSYLTFPTDGMLGDELSAAFWYKLNNSPDRAGVLVIGPPDTNNPNAQNNRTNGFRFFRENASGMQRFKLNVGNGTADSWFDGGSAADVDPSVNEWVHLAFTISSTECVVYINGEVVKQGAFTGVGWEGCDILSIMSGAPRFTGWNHLSDQSYMDDLQIFKKALTQEQIQSLMD